MDDNLAKRDAIISRIMRSSSNFEEPFSAWSGAALFTEGDLAS